MTKEELQIKLGQLEADNSELKKFDLNIRTEISKLLGAKYKVKDFYSKDSEIISYSWIEIAFEIGKLKESKKNSELEEEFKHFIDTVESRFNDIYTKINK